MSEIINEEVLKVPTIVTGDQQSKGASKFSKADVAASDGAIPRSRYHSLKGFSNSGTHGGTLHVLGYQKYMAGSQLRKYKFNGVIHMEPIVRPTFSRLKATFYAIYVPDSRVWKNADKYYAQRSDRFVNKVPQKPGIAYTTQLVGGQWPLDYRATTAYRESIMYQYFPELNPYQLYNALLVRGYVAAKNDIFRDKQIEPALPEFNDDGATLLSGMPIDNSGESAIYASLGAAPGSVNTYTTEYDAYLRLAALGAAIARVPAAKNYYNSFRTELAVDNDTPVDLSTRQTHTYTQQEIDDFRQRSQVVQMTDEEVIALLRGSQVAKENKCYIIGQTTRDIDLSLQQNVADGALSLGADGAFSYTPLNLDIVTSLFTAPRDGYIHYMYTITSDDNAIPTFTSNFEEFALSSKDEYRPRLAKQKDRALFTREIRGGNSPSIAGYIRKYSEYTRLPITQNGDFHAIWRGFEPNFERLNHSGFAFHYQQDPTQPANLPNQQQFQLTRELGFGSWQSYISVTHLDYTDFALQLILENQGSYQTSVSGVNPIALMGYQLCTPRTFKIFGHTEAEIQQPIAEEIFGNEMPIGSEGE